MVCVISYADKLTQQLDAVKAQKDAEREAAMLSLRTEMQTLVNEAYAARDEYLAMYTKVK
jgi:hypothetical protein